MEFLHGLKDGFSFYAWGYVFSAGLFGALIIFLFQLIIGFIAAMFRGR